MFKAEGREKKIWTNTKPSIAYTAKTSNTQNLHKTSSHVIPSQACFSTSLHVFHSNPPYLTLRLRQQYYEH